MIRILLLVIFCMVAVAQPTGLPTEWPVERLPISDCSPVSQLTSLTFRPGDVAYRRRNPSVPSILCMGCPAGTRPPAVQCVARGLNDFGRPQWVCEAQNGMNLGNVDVVCEGCSGPGDSLFLKGSCQLQYQNTQNSILITGITATTFLIFLACCCVTCCFVMKMVCFSHTNHSIDQHGSPTHTYPTYGTTTEVYHPTATSGGGYSHRSGGTKSHKSFGSTSTI